MQTTKTRKQSKGSTTLIVPSLDGGEGNGVPSEVQEAALQPAKGIIVGLKPISIGTLTVTIEGLSPLIAHAWGSKAVREMLDQQQMTKEAKKVAKQNRKAKDPEEDFQQARYIVDGKDVFPTVAVKKAMCDAGYVLGIPKAVVRQAIFIEGDYFVIKTPKNKPIRREDTVRVGPFGNRTADLRYRPQYDNWSATLTIHFRRDMASPDQIIALLQNAGFSVGLGEWRPQRDGQFGRFTVKGE